MSKPESLELSAEDLMPSWVSEIGLAKVPPAPTDRGNDWDGERRSRGGNDRGGQGFKRADAHRNDDRRQGGRGKGDRHGRDRGGRNGPREDGRREERQPQRAEDIVPEVEFIAEPTPEAITALAKQIRLSNRAYAVADIAKMVLAGADRYRVAFRTKSRQKKKPSTPEEAPSSSVQPKPVQLVCCKTDGSVWLSREEAIAHVLNSPDLIKEFYHVEEVATDAPKGNFTVVAVCGMSGTVLGPPNHHEYQQNIARVHRERFGNMPLEKFKSRIKMCRDEETIEQWKQERSTAWHYRVRTEKPRAALGPSAENQQVEPEAGEAPVAGSAVEETATETLADSQGEISPEETGDNLALEEQQTGRLAEDGDGEAFESSGGGTGTAEDAAANEAGDAAETAGQAQGNEDGPSHGPSGSAPAITSMVELTRHFREHFAKRIFKEVNEARLPGTASAKSMSPALHQRMEAEINWQKRGFPLPMVRVLCRRLEHQGLKFFKRGQKTLYVSASRPRALAEDTVLTDRLLLMLNFINEHPGTLAGKLVNHLLGDKRPELGDQGNTPGRQVEPSKAELGLLADLRWLLTEGYLIEFPSSELLPGTAVSVDKRKRRPSKRPKKKRLPGEKALLTGLPASAEEKPSSGAAPEAPVPVQAPPEPPASGMLALQPEAPVSVQAKPGE